MLPIYLATVFAAIGAVMISRLLMIPENRRIKRIRRFGVTPAEISTGASIPDLAMFGRSYAFPLFHRHLLQIHRFESTSSVEMIYRGLTRDLALRLADVDLNSTRLLLAEGRFVTPAQYVNQTPTLGASCRILVVTYQSLHVLVSIQEVGNQRVVSVSRLGRFTGYVLNTSVIDTVKEFLTMLIPILNLFWLFYPIIMVFAVLRDWLGVLFRRPSYRLIGGNRSGVTTNLERKGFEEYERVAEIIVEQVMYSLPG